VENRSGTYTIENARPNATYTLKVQGCHSRTLASSVCSPWVEESVTTVGEYGPDTCRGGFVWRDAGPNDHVCVRPEARTQAAADNSNAASRRQPGGGPYGPDTCVGGYVWREAFAGDRVCVTPEIRNLMRTQNQQAARTRICR
jgi:hypothetical protein